MKLPVCVFCGRPMQLILAGHPHCGRVHYTRAQRAEFYKRTERDAARKKLRR